MRGLVLSLYDWSLEYLNHVQTLLENAHQPAAPYVLQFQFCLLFHFGSKASILSR